MTTNPTTLCPARPADGIQADAVPGAPAPVVGPDPQTVRADLILAGRAMLTGEHLAAAQELPGPGRFLAGWVAAAEVSTVPRPGRLLADEFPDVDPAVLQQVWERAVEVGVRAGRTMSAPRWAERELAVAQERLSAAGFAAMAQLVGDARQPLLRASEVEALDNRAERDAA